MDFILGGVSASLATVFTNPLEVIKTRMQLQGELGMSLHRPYPNTVRAFLRIVKTDGFRGLQKGLIPSLYVNFLLNSFRLGIYSMAFEQGLTQHPENEHVSLFKSAFWGGIGGLIGASIASPFYMIKIRLQSKTKHTSFVGYQYNYNGMYDALKEIYRKHGVRGLYYGVHINIPLAFIGSGTQLATFGCLKDFLQRNYADSMSHITISLFSGMISGKVMAVVMNPFNVLATRLYNQELTDTGKGMYYKGIVDCLVKVIQNEGFRGLYKGFSTYCMRIGPHTGLVLFFYDELRILKSELYEHEILREKKSPVLNTPRDSLRPGE